MNGACVGVVGETLWGRDGEKIGFAVCGHFGKKFDLETEVRKSEGCKAEKYFQGSDSCWRRNCRRGCEWIVKAARVGHGCGC